MNDDEQDPIPAPEASSDASPSVAAEGPLGDGPLDGAPLPDASAPVAPSAEELATMAASAPVPTADEIAGLAAATAAATPLPGLHASGDADESTEESRAAEEAAGKKTRRRRRIRAWILQLAVVAFAIALFVGGLALGGAVYQRVQPPPTQVGETATGGIAAPAVVAELAEALASNNADSLRSVVSGAPWRLLTGELQSWNMQGVTSVETLATMQDGPRSATAIIIKGTSADGSPLVFNLIVHVDDNQIVNFR
jgi:hypothetical protein